jgi:pSer/pThr/pTyr-binding forkhead associated (FHA) protein
VEVGEEFYLLAAATIGRDPTNLVVLGDRFVSAQHALIFLKEGRRVLRDRGSTNGTYLNGERIEADAHLYDGDQIAIGTTLLEYEEPEPNSPIG